MKKITLIAIAFIFSCASAFAIHSTTAVSDTTKAKKVKAARLQYTCTMHPEVLSDKPGKCPKCGMKLVEKKPARQSGKAKI